MSQSVPPKTQDQPEGPNPLEVFYEKNKKWIYLLAVLVVAAVATDYFVRQVKDAARDAKWSEVTEVTRLSDPYKTSLDLNAALGGDPRQAQWTRFLKMRERGMSIVGGLMAGLKDAEEAQISDVAQAATDDLKPWMIWAAAAKAYASHDYDLAETHLSKLKSAFPKHLLCSKGAHPPQVQEEKEKPKKDKKKKDDTPVKRDEPEFEDAVEGSPVDNLLAAIAANKAFKTAHPSFFEAPKPDDSETAIIKFNDFEIEIAFYPKSAAEHVARFKEAIKGNKHYVGMRIHKIMRDGNTSPDPLRARTVHLGNTNTKEEDRAKWSEPVEAEEKDILEFENGQPSLSCFPFMVCAETEEDGKSSALRFFICVNDGASTYDGERVIFGRVIRGMNDLEDVASGDLSDKASDDRGEGRPLSDSKVVSTELKTK